MSEMYWANRLNRVTGMALLLLPITSVLVFLFGIPLGELDTFARDDVRELLETLDENRELLALSLSSVVVQDVVVLPVAAALLYLAFRDRSHSLALIWAFGLIVAAACAAVHEVGILTLAFLADDFVKGGGPGGIAPGDPVILQAARTIGVLQGSTALMSQTALALSLTALGLILGWSPSGERVPPRWLGYPGIIAGICALGMWTFFLDHTVGGVITLVGELAALLVMTVLGIWFLRQPESL